ncbi:sulfite exporter TauE/SafE family protein [Aquihabitans sp. G128]|uniref:sulfite exporter TauE/SafE family protein n=1 Tax=Aquihabitans sp. G128 TaxID=2849779 RepID=UPI001C243052|nr:sulfite exporter TauE/SafE family protein [Aquihabitans sp. G128]QXC61067.1 sulfite exporter TauE/SafE family protein [Aquihabitans sp. G128]
MTLFDGALVAFAGLLCGIVNSIAGGGSLILFPALLGTGMSSLSANVTNSVATWPGYLGGVVGFRDEIRSQRKRLPPLVVATLAGSTVGCVLLLVTPEGAFDVVVPFLVLFASGLTALQPWAKRRMAKGAATGERPSRAAVGGIFVAALYGGYFGGALGVIIVGVLGLTVHDTFRRLNAGKSLLSLVDASVSVTVFGLFGPVEWQFAAVAAPSTLLGGFLGAKVAKRLDEKVLRACVVGFGVLVSIYLLIRAL